MITKEQMKNLIRDDAFAITFQTMAQYRNALVKEIERIDTIPVNDEPLLCKACGTLLTDDDLDCDVAVNGSKYEFIKCPSCGQRENFYQ